MARFGMVALQSAEAVARRFRSQRTRALFAGLAAHSFLSLDEPLSAAVRNPDGGAGPCSWLAHSSRRRAVAHKCAYADFSRRLGSKREDFIAGPGVWRTNCRIMTCSL
jgi:hypothetical protein